MDQMAYYNDSYFNMNFSKYHENDISLICQNNIVYYNGEPKVLSGMIKVNTNERIYLGKYKISNINNNVWQLEPYLIFFYIRESVKLLDIDVKNSVIDIYKLASKSYIDESDKLSLSYTVDYYNSLKTIEHQLSGELYESYQNIKNMFMEIRNMNESNITPGFKLIYEKLFGEIKNDINNNSTSNSKGIARSRIDSSKPKAILTPIYQDNQESDQKINNAAFISVVALVILILTIVIGTMTFIFS